MRQTSLFDGSEVFKIDKPIRLIEFFAGYGAQALALKYLGVPFEHWKIAEWAVKSIQAYKDLHFADDDTDYSAGKTFAELVEWLTMKGISANYNEPMTEAQVKRLGESAVRRIYNNIIAAHNLVSVCNVRGADLEIFDADKYCYLLTYSFPCCLSNTLIQTKNGFKNIQDVQIGDRVLTHKNQYCAVTKTMTKVSDHYYDIKALGVRELFLTAEHPLYVLRNEKCQWVRVKDLTCDDWLSININTRAEDVLYDDKMLWLLGRYVADGHYNRCTYNSINFSIAFEKEKEFLENCPTQFRGKFKKFKKACWDYRIAQKDFKDLCLTFHSGATRKELPQWVINLPKERLQKFFDGYISGDGHRRERSGNTEIMFCTTSRILFYQLQQIIAKLYGVIPSMYIRKDGRKKSFSDCYCGEFTIGGAKDYKQKKIGDKIFLRVDRINKIDEKVQVFNLEVSQHNSYTANNVIVHNCQDLSNAGMGAGMRKGSGTRSGLLWEVERILAEIHRGERQLPQVLIMENVPEVHGAKNIKDFANWLAFLEKIGYKSYWQDLNAKDFCIPQNRNRTFCVSLLGDYLYEFPEKMPLEKRLKDVLEREVDEKYYLSDKALEGVLNTDFNCTKLESRIETGGVLPTICARDYKDPKLTIEKK